MRFREDNPQELASVPPSATGPAEVAASPTVRGCSAP